jgi:hypothetical protein
MPPAQLLLVEDLPLSPNMTSLPIYLIFFLRPLETTYFTNTLLFGPQSITHIDLSSSARALATAHPMFRSSLIQEILHFFLIYP